LNSWDSIRAGARCAIIHVSKHCWKQRRQYFICERLKAFVAPEEGSYSITMNRNSLFHSVALLLALVWQPVAAQTDNIPETSGFSGYANAGFTYWNVATNIVVGGSPIVLDDVSETRISSIFVAPSAKTSPGWVAGGEISYTLSGSRTQLFFGNRLEDLLRMDMVLGIGVRQQIGHAGILAASYLLTPVEVGVWST